VITLPDTAVLPIEDAAQRLAWLTPDQLSFVEGLVAGKEHKEVEEQTGIPYGVGMHFINQKLSITSTRELVALYLRATEDEAVLEDRRRAACDIGMSLYSMHPSCMLVIGDMLKGEKIGPLPKNLHVARQEVTSSLGITPEAVITNYLTFRMYGTPVPMVPLAHLEEIVLTPAERETLELLCGECLTTKQTSERRHCSVKTVETHRQHIRDKLTDGGYSGSLLAYYIETTTFDPVEIASAAQSTNDLLAQLTAREVETLDRLANDMSTRAIADEFHISIKTIETHRQHIVTKAGCCLTKFLRDYILACKHASSS
jgi:DNA-binding CsgD family transcriptional regulator